MLDTRQCCRRVLLSLALAGAAIWTTGCASPQLAQSRAAFHAGDFANAAAVLEDEAPGKDPVLFLMERGAIRQAAGDYKGSSADLIAAAERITETERYSLSEGAASFVVNDTVQEYQGEVYERAAMHALTALNHFAVARWDLAAVEARRIVYLLDEEHRGKYPDVAFARYVAGLAFELTGDPSNAALQYRKADALAPGVNLEAALGRPVAGGPELVVFVQVGRARSPIAQQRPARLSYGGYAEFYDGETLLGRSYALTDTYAQALETIRVQAAARAAKTVTRVVAKDAVADAIADENAALGALAHFILIGILEQPDLRYWSTLPRSLQVARVACPPDLKLLRVVYRHAGGQVVSESNVTHPITRRGRTFVTFDRQP